MATTTPTSTPFTEKTVTVQRLVVETAKYLGEPVGSDIPIGEVRRQAVAEGYGDDDDPTPYDREIDALLAEAGLTGASTVTVPPQGDLFGDLWPGPASGPTDDTDGVDGDTEPSEGADDVSESVERFREWLAEKTGDRIQHAYSRNKADRRYARANDVDRWFCREYDTFSTVLLTFCADRQPAESVVGHANRFYPRSVTGKCRRALKSLSDDYAGVRVLAPKPMPNDRKPSPDPQKSVGTEPVTHAHTAIWVSGEASTSDFTGILDLHVKNVDGATTANNPVDRAVSVWANDGVPTDVPGDRSATPLPPELGNNLPLLSAQFDARGLPAWAERWCANMRLGADDRLDTRGLSRWQPFGRFTDIADERRGGRDD